MRESLLIGGPQIPIPRVDPVATKYVADNSLAAYFAANSTVKAVICRVTKNDGADFTVTEDGQTCTVPLETGESIELYVTDTQVLAGAITITIYVL